MPKKTLNQIKDELEEMHKKYKWHQETVESLKEQFEKTGAEWLKKDRKTRKRPKKVYLE